MAISAKGVDVRQTSSGLLCRAFLQTGSGLVQSGAVSTLRLYELQADATLKTFDYNDGTFKTTTPASGTIRMVYQLAANGTVETGLWTFALSGLTGFTPGGVYFAHVNNTSGALPDQMREFQFGGDQGDLVVTSGGSSGVGYLQVDIRQLLGTGWVAPATAGLPDVNAIVSVGTTNSLGDYLVPLVGGVDNNSSTANTIVLTNAAVSGNYYVGMLVVLYKTASPAQRQVRTIRSYVGATRTATVDRPWDVVPVNNDRFAILAANAVALDSGQVLAGVASGQLSGFAVAPLSGFFFPGSGVSVVTSVSGQSVTMASGALSGQTVDLTSGRSWLASGNPVVTSVSGQQMAPASGSLSGQFITLLSGFSWLASGNPVTTSVSGQTTVPASGSLSGQTLDLTSGRSWLASGNLTVASASGQQVVLTSGQSWLASGNLVATSVSGQITIPASGSLSGQTVDLTSGRSWLSSGNPVVTSISGQSVTLASGATSGQPVSVLSGSSVVATLYSGQTAIAASGVGGVAAVTVANYLSGQGPAFLVLGAQATDWNTPNTIGAKINAAGGAADPWGTYVPGTYLPGQAGYIFGRLTGAVVTTSTPVAQNGNVTLFVGDDYATAEGRQLLWTGEATDVWPDLTNADLTFILDNGLFYIREADGVIQPTGTQQIRITLTAAQTLSLRPFLGQRNYSVRATLPNGHLITLVTGLCLVTDR